MVQAGLRQTASQGRHGRWSGYLVQFGSDQRNRGADRGDAVGAVVVRRWPRVRPPTTGGQPCSTQDRAYSTTGPLSWSSAAVNQRSSAASEVDRITASQRGGSGSGKAGNGVSRLQMSIKGERDGSQQRQVQRHLATEGVADKSASAPAARCRRRPTGPRALQRRRGHSPVGVTAGHRTRRPRWPRCAAAPSRDRRAQRRAMQQNPPLAVNAHKVPVSRPEWLAGVSIAGPLAAGSPGGVKRLALAWSVSGCTGRPGTGRRRGRSLGAGPDGSPTLPLNDEQGDGPPGECQPPHRRDAPVDRVELPGVPDREAALCAARRTR